MTPEPALIPTVRLRQLFEELGREAVKDQPPGI